MNAWDATTYEGKETILRVVRDEAARLIEPAGRPGAWEARPRARGGPSATWSVTWSTRPLTTFGRSNAGTVRGDQEIADRYLNLFFRI